MTSRSEILRRLPAFNNEVKVLIKDQDTDDIIKAILKAHEAYKNDYDKICSLFYTGDEISTARNVFNYIKKNVKYVIESDDRQMIKSPSGIFSTPSSDCKNYALAINGILDACRRKYGFDCDLYFRFAAYDGSNTPQHVFAVMNTDKGEIWIDPVLDEFNEDRQPNYYKDKKIKNMALMALSGIDPYENDQTALTRNMGAFTLPTPPKLTLAQGTGLNVVPPTQFNLSSILSGGNISQLVQSSTSGGNILDIATTALSFTGPVGAAAGAAIQAVKSLFKKKPNRNDWVGWDALDLRMGGTPGSSVYYWIVNDGDSVENEANNILSYITNKPDGLKNVIDSAASQYRNNDVADVLNKLYNKLTRGGYGNEATQTKQAIEQALTQQATSGYVSAGPIFPGGAPGATVETKKAGMSPLIILALVGAGAAIFLRKKK